MTRAQQLGTVALMVLSFLCGAYVKRDREPIAVAVNRPADVTTVASGPGCTPDHYPDFPDCRVLVQEWDRNGNVILSFTISPEDPVSRVFE